MELREYLQVVSNRKWIIVQAVILITTAAVAASFLQKPLYQAEATILFKGQSGGLSLFNQTLVPSSQPETTLKAQVELVKRRPVAANVAKKLYLSLSPGELLGKINVRTDSESNMIYITAEDADPKLASAIANKFAMEYIEHSRQSALKQLEKTRKEIFYRLRTAEEDVILLGEFLSKRSEGSSSSPDQVKAKLGIAASLYTVLSQKHEELRIMEALKTEGAELVSPAVTPSRPVQPKPISNGIIAFMASLVFGFGLAFVVEYFDNTIKTAEDAKRCFGLPILGQIPVEERSAKEPERKPIVSSAYSKSNEAEAYRALRTNIQYLNFDEPTVSIVVASGGPGEGKTTILTNLATTLAQAGRKVIVLCCDLRHPMVHKVFQVSNFEGLSSVLAGNLSFEQVLQSVEVENLKVLPSGPLPPNPSELLGSKRMEEVLEQAKRMADVVLIDTPPVLLVTDCVVLAPKVDGVILVASVGQATREQAKQVKEMLESVDARLLGTVLNNVVPERGRDYYYYYEEGRKKDEKKNGRLRRFFLARLKQ